jgi:hypothetical protein
MQAERMAKGTKNKSPKLITIYLLNSSLQKIKGQMTEENETKQAFFPFIHNNNIVIVVVIAVCVITD